MPTDDKKSTTKKSAPAKASNTFLAENPPPRMRGNRK
jgi:hypothetical protein